jgi:hypothetical protein
LPKGHVVKAGRGRPALIRSKSKLEKGRGKYPRPWFVKPP